ncbi:hypothetical protein AVEN_19569-1, partial [Araneus ventricosus]
LIRLMIHFLELPMDCFEMDLVILNRDQTRKTIPEPDLHSKLSHHTSGKILHPDRFNVLQTLLSRDSVVESGLRSADLRSPVPS